MLGPFTTASTGREVAAIPAPPAPVETNTEATQPPAASSAAAVTITTEQGDAGATPSETATTAEIPQDDSTTADTIQLPTVPDAGKKGK
jgi:hypothetical protein